MSMIRRTGIARLLRRLVTVFALLCLLIAPVAATSLNEAAQRVASQYDAKVLSAHTVERDGRRVHVIRILTRDGVVRTIRVPADR